MNKDEFLAFSLPYGLKVYDCIGSSIELVDYSKGCPKCVCEAIGKVKNESKCVNVFQAAYDKKLKPICHPLSDLTKPITHKGETFVPIEKLYTAWDFEPCKLVNEAIDDLKMLPREWSILKHMPYMLILKLVEWHFNLMNESEPFIDVNTLDKNPYE